LTTLSSRRSAPDGQPARRQWDGGDDAEGEYSRDVLVLVGHGHRHCEHDREMGAVRGQIEIEEQPVCARVARGCEQEDRPDDVDGENMTATSSPPAPQSNSLPSTGGSVPMRWVAARIRLGTKKVRYPTAVSRIITGSQAAARFTAS
jgi:hypothetical protein